MNKSNKWFVADFETTGENVYEKEKETRVWLYAISNSEGEIVDNGYSIQSFINFIKNKCVNSTIYFHNLKFDGSFILNYLIKNGFKYIDKITKKDNKAYSALIDNMGAFYQITINFSSKKQVIIYDTLKLIPLKVSAIAKAFNLKESKGKIDYLNYTIDSKTLEYVNNDVIIVAKALKYFKDNNFNKMTIGSNAFNLCSQEMTYFDYLFPIIDNDLLDKFRKAYRGGRSQVNPLHQGKILNKVKRYDINSMYPYCHAFLDLPYGQPIKCNTIGKYKFEIYIVDISFKLKENHLPTLLKNNKMYAYDKYYIDTEGIEEIVLSNLDYELLKRHYNISFLKFKEIYGFRTSNILFRDFIMKYYELKSNSSGPMKLIYKLVINNLYGKFGSKHKGKHKIPYIENSILKFASSEEEEMKKYYLPVAIAITSHAHMLIDNAIMATGYDKFVYCDTDSVHTLGDLPIEMVDNKEIGKFKLEGIEEVSKYVRTKCYVYKENNEINITCCGLPSNTKDFLIRKHGDDIFNVFDFGLKVDINYPDITISDLKLMPNQVKGGILLLPTQFEIRK